MKKVRRQDRWKTALHEAAHIVTARKLNIWDTYCRAVVLETGGGFYRPPRGLTETSTAIATCAGSYGGLLAQQMSIPRTKPVAVKKRQQHMETEEHAQDRQAFKHVCDDHPDAISLMQYALRGHATKPTYELKWRIDNVSDQAERLVEQHKEEIRKVARCLYHYGEVVFAGDGKDNFYFERRRQKRLEEERESSKLSHSVAAGK